MLTPSSEISSVEAPARHAALAVSPAVARQMLSVGQTRLYQLLQAGELASYREGRARRITTDSIRRYIERKLEVARASSTT